jgi:hypothetical protein
MLRTMERSETISMGSYSLVFKGYTCSKYFVLHMYQMLKLSNTWLCILK